MPKLQNFTQTFKAKMLDMKNNASTDLNQSTSSAKQSFFNQIMPKLQNFTQTFKAKMLDMKNNATPELSHGLNNTKTSFGQMINKIIPNSY
jgi:molecular chaperone GrpE (heat shock protein)